MNVQLADNLQGRVDITQCFKSIKDIKNLHQPLASSFQKGETLDVKVIESMMPKIIHFCQLLIVNPIEQQFWNYH